MQNFWVSKALERLLKWLRKRLKGPLVAEYARATALVGEAEYEPEAVQQTTALVGEVMFLTLPISMLVSACVGEVMVRVPFDFGEECEPGTFTFTGQDVDLTYEQGTVKKPFGYIAGKTRRWPCSCRR